MKNVDLEYLCTVIGNLSGIPIRIYDGDEPRFYYALVDLPRDPLCAHLDAVLAIRSSVGYLVTEQFSYYGVVNSGSIRIVIGPTSQTAPGEQELHALAFAADVPPEDTGDFISAMKGIVHMPLESVLQMLCTVNYFLNGEKLTLGDITAYDAEQEELRDSMGKKSLELALGLADGAAPTEYEHNSYAIEQNVINFVQRGDPDALREWAARAPAVRGGLLATNQLRQLKNTFVVTATLASRAAIRGGVDVEEALSLSDAYIQRCELLTEPDRIINLQYHMAMEFAERVARLRFGGQGSKLVIEVANYVRHHIYEAITTEAIAKHLYISRPHLASKFKAESGQTLTDFILKEKTEEAKRLLRYTDRTATAIAAYLGFSSQSHFTRVFKKYAGRTPSEYRARHVG